MIQIENQVSDTVKNDLVKKTAYDKLVANLNNTDTSDFVLKTQYNNEKAELEKKIPNTSCCIKKTDYNTKINEIEGKIPDISNLATKTVLTAAENKIPSVSNLVKKKKTKIPKLQQLKINLIIIIMANIINQLLMFFMQD